MVTASIDEIHSHFRRLRRKGVRARLGSIRFIGRLLGSERAVGPGLYLYRALRSCWIAVARRRTVPLGLIKHVSQLVRFTTSYHVDPESYYQHRLHSDWGNRNLYIFHDEIVAILGYLKGSIAHQDTLDLDDKRVFWKRCESRGLPAIPALLESNGTSLVEHGAGADFERDLFSKPVDRYCGEGATLWRYSAGRYFSDGRALTFQELKRHLASSGPVIVQPNVTPHSVLQPISGSGLSTARIITIRKPGGDVEIGLAVYRMPVGDAVADNFAAGGLAAPISLDDGRLGAAARKSDANVLHNHPTSLARIEGVILPHWEAAKALAVAAHAAFPTLPVIGWDIAITDDGPILVEGNATPGVELLQAAHRKPLGLGSIADCLAEHLRLVYATPLARGSWRRRRIAVQRVAEVILSRSRGQTGSSRIRVFRSALTKGRTGNSA